VFRIDSSNNTSIGSINSSSISISNGTEEFDQSTLIATALAAAKPTSRGVEEGCSNNSIGGNSSETALRQQSRSGGENERNERTPAMQHQRRERRPRHNKNNDNQR